MEYYYVYLSGFKITYTPMDFICYVGPLEVKYLKSVLLIDLVFIVQSEAFFFFFFWSSLALGSVHATAISW